MSFWDFSLENTGRTQIVSIQYQEQYGRAKKPVFMRVFAVSSVIPTQQTHENLLSNRVCVPAGQKLEIATPLVLAALLVRIWYESCRSSYQAVLAVLGRV